MSAGRSCADGVPAHPGLAGSVLLAPGGGGTTGERREDWHPTPVRDTSYALRDTSGGVSEGSGVWMSAGKGARRGREFY